MKLKKTSFLTKLLLLAVAIHALISLVNLADQISAAQAKEKALQTELYYKQQQVAQLEEDLADLGSDHSVKMLARKYLGMVEEGEIHFKDAAVSGR